MKGICERYEKKIIGIWNGSFDDSDYDVWFIRLW